MKSMCPLCTAAAEAAPRTSDRTRYDCPNCGAFEISGSEEAVVRGNPTVAQSHRERIARERERGITIHRIG